MLLNNSKKSFVITLIQEEESGSKGEIVEDNYTNVFSYSGLNVHCVRKTGYSKGMKFNTWRTKHVTKKEPKSP
jgi:hypothetical protein